MFVVFHVGKVADVYNGKYSNKVCTHFSEKEKKAVAEAFRC